MAVKFLLYLLVALVLASSVYGFDTTGLVSLWKLDNSTLDSFGSNDGTNAGAECGIDNIGQVNTSCNFEDDETDWISVPYSASLDWGIGDGSLCLWINYSSSPATDEYFYIHGGYSGGGKRYTIYNEQDDNKVKFGIDDNSNYVEVSSDSAHNDNAWHFICGVRDASGNATIYVDGNREGSAVDTTGDIDGTIPSLIGCGQSQAEVKSNYIDGMVDEITVWNKTLSQSEINSLYGCGTENISLLDCNTTSLEVTLDQPLDNNESRDDDTVTFNASVDAGSNGLVNCSLWHNQSGTWELNQTDWLGQSDESEAWDYEENLVGYWKLEGDVTDSSIYNNPSTNDGVTFTTGLIGQAGDFEDSENDVIQVMDANNLDYIRTFCTWVNYETIASSYSIAKRVESSDDAFQLGTGADSKTLAQMWTSVTTYSAVTTSTPAVVGDWQLQCGVVNATHIQIWINKTLYKSTAIASPNIKITTDNITIGRTYSTSFDMDGLIDEVMLFNKSLSSMEIGYIYDNGTAGRGLDNQSVITTPYPSQNNTNFTLSNMPIGSSTWNIQCYDNNSNSAWGTNRTLDVVSATAPTFAGSNPIQVWWNISSGRNVSWVDIFGNWAMIGQVNVTGNVYDNNNRVCTSENARCNQTETDISSFLINGTNANFNDLNVTGNFTGNQIYGEMWNRSASASPWTFAINATGTYYNLTGLVDGSLNGFTTTHTSQSEGGSYFTAQVGGLYKACSSISSLIGAASGDLYGYAISHNFQRAGHNNCYARRVAVNSVGNIGVCCFMDIETGDNINIQIEQESGGTARDVAFHTINVNLMRIGD